MKLTAKHWRAIYLIAEGKSQSETARILEVNLRTIRNWLIKEEFLDALAEVEKTKRIQMREAIGVGAVKAIEHLIAILDSPTAKEYDKIRAATILLTVGAKVWTSPRNDENQTISLGGENGIVATTQYTAIAPGNINF